MEQAFRVTVVALLVAILSAVIVEGNRIVRSMPGPPTIQDVSVVNTSGDPVPTIIVTSQGDTGESALGQRMKMSVDHSPKGRSGSLSPQEQATFDDLYGPAPSTSAAGGQ